MSDRLELCQLCGNPTGRCGEDSIYVDASDGIQIGPLCEECMNGIVHWVASDACISPNQQALADAKAEIAQLRATNAEQAKEIENLQYANDSWKTRDNDLDAEIERLKSEVLQRTMFGPPKPGDQPAARAGADRLREIANSNSDLTDDERASLTKMAESFDGLVHEMLYWDAWGIQQEGKVATLKARVEVLEGVVHACDVLAQTADNPFEACISIASRCEDALAPQPQKETPHE